MNGKFRNLDILDWEFKESDSSFGVHDACWYPAKLVAQIPAHLILNLSNSGDTILDPFCGSGTTLIEALRHGRKCVGVDVNPIAAYMSSAKCQVVSLELLEAAQERINKEFSRACAFLDSPKDSWFTGQTTDLCIELAENPSSQVPNYEENRGWFHPMVLNKLSVLKHLIWQEEPPLRDTLSLAFFSILRDCSSLPHRKPYTYIADNVKPKAENLMNKDVFHIYMSKNSRLLAGRKAYQDQCKLVMEEQHITAEEFNQRYLIKKADARNLMQYVSGGVDCVVTSPPYMGVTDTATGHRLWYLWHDFGSTLQEDKHTEIGARWKRKKQTLLTEYLEDMHKSLRQIANLLRSGGYLCLVIGEPERAKGKILDWLATMLQEELRFAMCRRYTRTIHKKWFEHPTGGVACEEITIFQKV